MNIQEEIRKLKFRNKRVEQDKAWETSWTRRLIIAILTYFVIVVLFYSANLPNPWRNSLVPALAYILSTLSMPYFRKWWKS